MQGGLASGTPGSDLYFILDCRWSGAEREVLRQEAGEGSAVAGSRPCGPALRQAPFDSLPSTRSGSNDRI